MEFVKWPKTPRISRDMIITEKIDGTNAQVAVEVIDLIEPSNPEHAIVVDNMALYAGSRNRWLTADKDNYGFFKWVYENREELVNLGPGRHYGEWWGQGIQRRYGLSEKRFSLFNTKRWGESQPSCCHIVPVLYEGPFVSFAVNTSLYNLEATGSKAAPGFMNPEGVIIYHTAAHMCFKKTLRGDGHKEAR